MLLLLTDEDLQNQTLKTTQICCLINWFSKPSSCFEIEIEIILRSELAC